MPIVSLSINYKNLINLECQRRERLKTDECRNYKFNYSQSVLEHNSEFFKVKLRVKGDRKLHFQDSSDYSFKADIKGESRLWGMEEFSIQDPIIRNYTGLVFESSALKDEGIVTPGILCPILF